MMNNSQLLLYLVVGIVAFFIGMRFAAPEIKTVIETETDTVTVVDTVFVIDTIEVIPEPDTVYVPLAEIDDRFVNGTRKITTSFSDTMLTARHQIDLDGHTGDVLDVFFEYMIKQRFVRTYQTTLTTNITTTTRETRTVYDRYFQVGAMTNFESVMPVAAFTTRDQTTIMYGYDIWNKSHNIGILIRF